MKKQSHKAFRKLNDVLEMPKEISTNEPKVTILGFHELFIENYKSILEYEDFFVKINTHLGCININGFNLKLNQMNQDDIMVTGKIETVDFESIED